TLNRLRLRTGGAGNTWHAHRVKSARSHNGLPRYDPAIQHASMLTLEEAALRLQVSNNSVRRLITEGILPAKQIVPCAPWQIAAEALNLSAVQHAAVALRNRCYKPQARQIQ